MDKSRVHELDPEGHADGESIVIDGGKFTIGPVAADAGKLTPYAGITATRAPGNPSLVDDECAMPENIIKVDGTYWLLYSSAVSSSYTRLHLASSSSPAGPWTPYGGNPILTAGSQAWEGTSTVTNAGCLLEVAGTFYLFYAVDTGSGATPGIGVATAATVTGPYTKSVSNPILSPGAGGTWDSLRVQEPDVQLMPDGTWVMAYMGEDSAFAQGTTEKIGIATAPAPTGPWTKEAANPVIGFGAPGDWDAAVAADPSLIRDRSGYWWCLYSGTSAGGGPGGAELGLAHATDPAGPWTKYGEILAGSGGSGDFDESGVFRGAIYYENGAYYLPYAGVPVSGSAFDTQGGTALLTVDSDADIYGHEAATDPHPQYLTQTEGDGRYVRTVNGVGPDGSGDVEVAGSTRWEVVMTSGTSSPPIPVETPDGTDWVYAEVEA